jgi:hypothetical protein
VVSVIAPDVRIERYLEVIIAIRIPIGRVHTVQVVEKPLEVILPVAKPVTAVHVLYRDVVVAEQVEVAIAEIIPARSRDATA